MCDYRTQDHDGFGSNSIQNMNVIDSKRESMMWSENRFALFGFML